MSTQEILLEEIKHQPEPGRRELRHHLDFLKRQRETEAPLDSGGADTWAKLGPPRNWTMTGYNPNSELKTANLR